MNHINLAQSPEQVAPAPAPWTLHGEGYILFFRFTRRFVLEKGFLPDDHHHRFRIGFGTVMLVDYRNSNAGPYRELLFIPGLFRYGSLLYPSISKIYVSTWESIVNGRENWAIPKEKAEFSIERSASGRERFIISRDGVIFADIRMRARRLALPFHTALIPSYFRTLVQARQHDFLLTIPRGTGQIRSAVLEEAAINNDHFPDFASATLLGAVKATGFQLHFPPSISKTFHKT